MWTYLSLLLAWTFSASVYGEDVPYVFPMILGRTFDISRGKSGVNVFPSTTPKTTISQSSTRSQIKIVRSSTDSRSVLDVSGSLSLQIKTGLLSIKGSGSYLKDTSNRNKMVEALIRVQYKSVTESFADNPAPYRDWSRRANVAGKHYVRAITYGGELIASLQFNSATTVEKERIEAALSAGIEVGGGGILDAKVEGHFKRALDMASDNTDVVIKYYATTHLDTQPQDLDSFMAAVNDFPNLAKKVNAGKGVPIIAHLHPLPGQDRVGIDSRYVSTLRTLEEDYDDIISAIEILDDWAKEQTCPLPAEKTAQLAVFQRNLLTVNRAFTKFVTNMKLIGNDHTEMERLIDEVQSAYEGTTGALDFPGKYTRALRAILFPDPPESMLISRLTGLVNFAEYSVNSQVAIIDVKAGKDEMKCLESIYGSSHDLLDSRERHLKLSLGYKTPLLAWKEDADGEFLTVRPSDIYQKDVYMVTKDHGFLAGRASLNLVSFQITKPEEVPVLEYDVENIWQEFDNRSPNKVPVVHNKYSFITDTSQCRVPPKLTPSSGVILAVFQDSENEVKLKPKTNVGVAGEHSSFLSWDMLQYFHVDMCEHPNSNKYGQDVCPFETGKPLSWYRMKQLGYTKGGSDVSNERPPDYYGGNNNNNNNNYPGNSGNNMGNRGNNRGSGNNYPNRNSGNNMRNRGNNYSSRNSGNSMRNRGNNYPSRNRGNSIRNRRNNNF